MSLIIFMFVCVRYIHSSLYYCNLIFYSGKGRSVVKGMYTCPRVHVQLHMHSLSVFPLITKKNELLS